MREVELARLFMRSSGRRVRRRRCGRRIRLTRDRPHACPRDPRRRAGPPRATCPVSVRHRLGADISHRGSRSRRLRCGHAAACGRAPKPLRKLNQRLYAECVRDGFCSIQEAVDAVTTRGTRILIQPGVDNEQPSLVPLSPERAAIDESDAITYEQQLACPHAQNLIGIFGDGPDADIACDDRLCDLQVEGTGASR